MHKILIVDDDPSLRMLVSHMISKLGYVVCEAVDGLQGELLGIQWRPDVILLDIMMPEQDGTITATNLRERGYTGRIILMSAFAQGFRPVDVQTFGADEFLPKPIPMTVLERCLKANLAV